MQMPTKAQAEATLRHALAAAGIDVSRDLNYAFAGLTAVECQAFSLWVSIAWANGYGRGSEDELLKRTYTPASVPPPKPTPPPNPAPHGAGPYDV